MFMTGVLCTVCGAQVYFTFRDRAFIFGMCVPCDKTFFDGTINFDHTALTVTFDLYLENFNSAHNFLTITHRAFILGKCVLYDKTFPMVL